MSIRFRAITLSVFCLILSVLLATLGAIIDRDTRNRIIAEDHAAAEARWETQGYIPSIEWTSHTHKEK